MDIEAELQNWARWVRERVPQAHCRSIESRYRLKSREDDTPTGWGDYGKTAPRPSLPPVDALAAVQVESCMRFLPVKHRKALKLFYVYQADARWCCRRLALGYDAWPEFIETARRMLVNRLTVRENARRFRLEPVNAVPGRVPSEPVRLVGQWGTRTTEEPA